MRADFADMYEGRTGEAVAYQGAATFAAAATLVYAIENASSLDTDLVQQARDNTAPTAYPQHAPFQRSKPPLAATDRRVAILRR